MSGFLFTVRACGVTCLAGLASVAIAGVASAAAAQHVAPLSHAETASAVAAAHSDRAASIARTNLSRSGDAAATRANELDVANSGVPVYSLNPDFVRGEDGAAAGRFAYYAVAANSPAGSVTIDAVRNDGGSGWHVAKVAGGKVESSLAAQLPAGAKLLNEPQLDAWYAWTGDELTLLEAGMPKLRNRVGRSFSIADYQRLVAERYGDKLPGSDYAKQQKIGGYGVGSGAAALRPTPGSDSTAPDSTGTEDTVLWAVGGAAVLAAAGVTVAPATRRRLRRR